METGENIVTIGNAKRSATAEKHERCIGKGRIVPLGDAHYIVRTNKECEFLMHNLKNLRQHLEKYDTM